MGSNGTRRGLTACSLLELLRGRPFARQRWDAVCGDHLHIRIGNCRTRTQRRDALDALERFCASTRTMAFGFLQAWCDRETIVLETDVVAQGAAPAGQAIPCVVIARTVDGLLVDLRLYCDLGSAPRS